MRALSNIHGACSGPAQTAAQARETRARAERVLYATSRSGFTALLWARWMVWVCEQPPLDASDGEAVQREAQTRERAVDIATFLASRGAVMRTRDEVALEALRTAYRNGSADKSLLRLDPAHLKVLGMAADGDGGAAKDGFARRMGEMRNLKGHQKYAFYTANYKPRGKDGGPLLEAFLLEMGSGERGHKYATDDGRLFAPDFHGSWRCW